MSAFLNFSLPLWAYILLWAGLLCIIAFFAVLYALECNDKAEVEALLRETWNELEAKQTELKNALEIGQPELAELNHDYATLGMLVEDLHQNIADVQKELFAHDERLNRVEQRSITLSDSLHMHRHRISESDDYVGPDDEDDDECGPIHPNCQCDGDTATLLPLLPGWLDNVKEGLDEL